MCIKNQLKIINVYGGSYAQPGRRHIVALHRFHFKDIDYIYKNTNILWHRQILFGFRCHRSTVKHNKKVYRPNI